MTSSSDQSAGKPEAEENGKSGRERKEEKKGTSGVCDTIN
jgi:hypothetical protein